ncbi:hypothetical protein [Streptomyces torulosus]|uniref:hypothetical protein n=1 Tax=Streptomyces torulosus TaxID=68276 RepID=UPI0006EB6193
MAVQTSGQQQGFRSIEVSTRRTLAGLMDPSPRIQKRGAAASDAHGWLRIAGAQHSVLGVLQLVGLDEVISCHHTVEQALTV